MFSFDQEPPSVNFFIFLKHAQIDPKFNINNLAGEGRIDLLCRVFTNVFFLPNNFRINSNLYVFFQRDNILIKFIGNKIKKVNPDERSIAGYLKKVFRIIMENSTREEDFIWEYASFEDIAKKTSSGYLLDPKGKSIKECNFTDCSLIFFLGDHLGLNENEKSFLEMHEKLSLGKRELLSSQCVTIIYHYIDDRLNTE